MRFTAYIRDRLFCIVTYVTFFLVFWLMMVAFRSPVSLMRAFALLLFFLAAANLSWDYLRKRKFYQEFLYNLASLDKKYLVLETIENPGFYEGQIWHEAMYEINKSMLEHLKGYEESIRDFKEYIEMWVHEVKLPIASLLLMCHNNRGAMEKKYVEQIRRVDSYTDQVLYYVRSEHTENDYIIKEVSLADLVRKTALKNKDDLLENGIDFFVEHVDVCIITDAKWMEFILNQLVNNSMKYKKKEDSSVIRIFAKQDADKTVLHVWDNGVGIAAGDLPQVYKKAFTGENGRTHAKSTGMGLYIVKQLCNKLGHGIEISTIAGEYTDVQITFTRNDYYFRD